jgi:hypothetical protein
MKNLHHSFKKNKKVFVILTNGKSFVDRWLPFDGKTFNFVAAGKIRGKKIRSIGVYNPMLAELGQCKPLN